MVVKSQPEAHTVSVAGEGVGVGGVGVRVGGMDVSVGGMGVSVGVALLTGVSVGGGEVAVGGTGVAVGNGLVPQPFTVRTRRVAVKSNGKSFFIFVLLPPLSNTPATSGFLPENPKAFHEIPDHNLN